MELNALDESAISLRSDAALQRLPERDLKVLACFKASLERQVKLAEQVTENALVERTVENTLVHLSGAGLLQHLGAEPDIP